jgi:fumarylpyruvate hydrolase
MTDFVFAPPAQPALPVVGQSGRFPVRRIFCVGKNYAAHAREMGGDPTEPPVFFTKPADAVCAAAGRIPFPQATRNLHHEVELVVALKSGGVALAPQAALDCVYGYTVGNDLTRRDLQAAAKTAGNPWDTAKGFDNSASVAPITPVAVCGHPTAARIWLAVNGAIRQDANINDLMWSVPQIIHHLSNLFELKAGDLIFTGTPEGVGPIAPGDRVTGGIDGLGALDLVIG